MTKPIATGLAVLVLILWKIGAATAGSAIPASEPMSCSNTVSTFPYSESFESGFGLWTQDTGDDFDWTRTNTNTPTSGTGPSGAIDGSYYLFAEADNYPQEETYLNSPCFDLSNAQAAFFSYRYHMYGSKVGHFKVEISTNMGSDWTALASRYWSKGDYWRSEILDLTDYIGQTIMLRFFVRTNTTNSGDIAIDDVDLYTIDSFGSLSCATTVTSYPYEHGFETGYDGWTQDSGDDKDWYRHSGSTPTNNTGPDGACEGSYFIYTESSNYGGDSLDGYPNKTIILTSPCFDLDTATTANFQFKYHMKGNTMGTLRLEVTPNGTDWIPLWSKSGDQDSDWLQAGVNLSAFAGQTIKLRFYAVTGSLYHSDMAVDDLYLSLQDGGTPVVCGSTINSFPYTEGFEGSVPGWQYSASPDATWMTKSGPTSTSSTGPASAAVGSYYLYIESDSPNNPNKTAMITSPCLDLNQASQASVDFKYHMYGASMGSLYLEVLAETTEEWTTIWSKTGDQGNYWYQAEVDLGAFIGQNIKIRYRGVTGSSNKSDMAIDDVNVELEPATSDSTGCVTVVSTYPYFESFESGWGAWKERVSNNIWQRNSGHTPSNNTGPASALHESYYLFTEASGSTNTTAVLDGPCFDLTTVFKPAVEFYYHMRGYAIGTLKLEASTDNGATWTTLWSKTGEQGTDWNVAKVSLKNYAGQTVKLRYYATTGSSLESDMAVDAIYLGSDPELEDGTLFGTVYFPTALACTPDALSGSTVENVYVTIDNHTAGSSSTYASGVSGGFAGYVDGGEISISGQIYSSNWVNGVSTFDVIRINKHAGDIDVIDCPLFRLAGDVDNDGDVDSTDAQTVTQLVLTTIDSFSQVPNWRIIPKAYARGVNYSPDPAYSGDFWNQSRADIQGNEYPFKAQLDFNSKSYTYDGADSWLGELDHWTFDSLVSCQQGTFDLFIVKTGDVNGTAVTTGFGSPPSSLRSLPRGKDQIADQEYELLYPKSNLEKAEKSGDRGNKKYEVKIVATTTSRVEGYQLGIQFDDELLELGKIKPNKEDLNQTEAKNFGRAIKTARGGTLKTVWVNDFKNDPRGKEFGQNLELFSFEFKSKATLGQVRSAVRLDNGVWETAFYGKDGPLEDVDIQIFVEEVK